MLGDRTTTRRVSTARRTGPAVLLVCTALVLTACVPQSAPPAPAVLRETPPPWPVPRDAVSYIDLAGLPASRLDDRSDSRTFTLTVVVGGQSVQVPPYLGIDRPRALQAPVHTHDASGTVWLEGTGTQLVTVGKMFTVWGVRADARCLGATCGRLTAMVDGRPAEHPLDVRLVEVRRTLEINVSPT